MQLNTISWGDGPRSALLLHGITSSAAGWWRLGPDIAALGYSVVAADLRGHGHSPESDDHLVGSHVDDVLSLAERWDVVLGHSMGGAIAMLAAVDDPGWTERLILEDPAIVLPNLPVAIEWLLADFEGEVTADRLASRFPEWPRADAEAKAEALRQCGPEVVEMTFTQNDPWDFREPVASLRTPTTIIGAAPELGALIPSWFGEELATNESVDFVQVAGTHSMHRDAWADFWRVVSGLL